MKTKEEYRSCRDCKTIKHKSLFTKNHVFSDGIDTLCLECNHRRVKEWRASGKRKSKEESAKYYSKHPEKCKERSERRRIRVGVATPSWISGEEIFLIDEAKNLAKRRSESTGFLWHIDHIVPIGAAHVCGLNVPWNIRVVPAKENWTKATKILEHLL